MEQYPVVALFGPTGVGKTGVAVELAERFRSDLGIESVAVNCDSIQAYRGLEILSGASDALGQDRLEHRLLAHIPLKEEYSASRYGSEAHREIDLIRDSGRVPIVVGGTGLYLRAALSELEMIPPPSDESLASVESEVAVGGLGRLHSDLPDELRSWVHPNDRKRIIRFSALLRDGVEPRPSSRHGGRLWTADHRVATIAFGLTVGRDDLRERIDRRVEAMFAAGVEEEVHRVEKSGASRTARAAVGFKEVGEGDLEAVKRSQLRLARRQATWLSRMSEVSVIDRSGLDDAMVASLISACFRESQGEET